MSAFICSDKHIATVVMSLDPKYHPLQLIANRIKAANIKSVNYRYNEKTRSTSCDLSQGDPDLAKNPEAVIKLAQSIDYQSCELDNWERTRAYAHLHYIASQAGWKLISERDDNLPWSL